MPRKTKTTDAPAAVPPAEPKMPALGHIQSELADLAADFVCYGGWNDTHLHAFILLCMKNRWIRHFKEREPGAPLPATLPEWVNTKAKDWVRELVRETDAFPVLKPGEAVDGAPVKEVFKARTRQSLGHNFQGFLDTANAAELSVMEEVMMFWDGNNINMLEDAEVPILHALDNVIRDSGRDTKFIQVPERFESKVRNLLKALHSAEKAAEVE